MRGKANLLTWLMFSVFLLLIIYSTTKAQDIYAEADSNDTDTSEAITVFANPLKESFAIGQQVPLEIVITNHSLEPVYIIVDDSGYLPIPDVLVEDTNGASISYEFGYCPPPAPPSHWIRIDGERIYVVPVAKIEPDQTSTMLISDALKFYQNQDQCQLQAGTYNLKPLDITVIHDVGFIINRKSFPIKLWIDPYTIVTRSYHEINKVEITLVEKIIYVDDDSTGANDGTNWQDAYVFLQDALADANESEKPIEIRVAQGVYKPDQGANQTLGDREATFQMINLASLKGGYAGVSLPDPNAHDIKLYETILSGDLANNDIYVNDLLDLWISQIQDPFGTEPNREDNSYHAVTGNDTDGSAVLDGFTIAGGNADYTYPDNGGGMYNLYGNPTITNCTFSRNSAMMFGGGIYNNNSNPNLTNCTFVLNYSFYGGGMNNYNSSPVLNNCVFVKNFTEYPSGAIVERAQESGGGMYNSGSSPILINCKFNRNSAHYGGGMYNDGSAPVLINCIFSGNSGHYGGGMGNWESNPTLTNCTFSSNSANSVGGITCGGNPVGLVTLINCIVWDNVPATDQIRGHIYVFYSDIQGGWPGVNNIDIDPLFANPGYWADAIDTNIIAESDDPNAVWIDGDYHLKSQAGRWDPSSGSWPCTESGAGWVVDDITSPCIDAGDPNSSVGDEPEPNSGRINMGAYGGTIEASKSYDESF